MTDVPASSFSGPDLCRLTACEIVDLLKTREVSSVELVEASLARIAQTSPKINAMVTTCGDRARAAAGNVDAGSLLAGLPLGIKDLNAVAGVRSTWGTQALADFIPKESDPLVERIEARGGVVMGKTNSPEMGAGANTFNAVFGMTRNPWNIARNAAGSSGGAAASLATGETWLSQGSDHAGSLRTPASFCGVVGLRPSPGLVPWMVRDNAFDGMPTQGPMARNVTDVALFLDAMTGREARVPLSYPASEGGYLAAVRSDPGDIRIAFSPDLGGLGPVTPEMAHVLSEAMARVGRPGLDVTEETPAVTDIVPTFRTLRALSFWTAARMIPDEITRHYKPALKQNIVEGRALVVEDIAKANVARSHLFHVMHAFLTRFDVLACPVTGIGPGAVEEEYPPRINEVASRDYVDWLCFAFLATLCGLPAISVPVGFTRDGLPVGIQLIGAPRGEARLLQVARAIEESIGFSGTPIDPIG